ncbi:MAG: hypothetical protein JXA89_13465, partial [Anaerolineae bacterium]|nr:hypothetical protein [Anaerolineae bacterium]
MKNRGIPSLLLCAVLIAALLPGEPVSPERPAYVEPALGISGAPALSVIVTATSSERAAQAVSRLGGQVT